MIEAIFIVIGGFTIPLLIMVIVYLMDKIMDKDRKEK